MLTIRWTAALHGGHLRGGKEVEEDAALRDDVPDLIANDGLRRRRHVVHGQSRRAVEEAPSVRPLRGGRVQFAHLVGPALLDAAAPAPQIAGLCPELATGPHLRRLGVSLLTLDMRSDIDPHPTLISISFRPIKLTNFLPWKII